MAGTLTPSLLANRGHANMLKGFSVPLTPDGKSALATMPPWHYSSDCIAIEYWADPVAIDALLPPGLVLDEKSGGRAFFWFLDWQFTASNDELTDPARYQYREAFALVEATFEGTPVNYCPYIFVDNDAGMARGWAQGCPKKLGSIFQTRSFSAPSPAAAPLANGSRFGAQPRSALGEIGDRTHRTRGASRRSFDGFQSPDNNAPVLFATRRPSAKASGERVDAFAHG
jgi:hypothetical protein